MAHKGATPQTHARTPPGARSKGASSPTANPTTPHAQKTALRQILNMLTLAYHRNKNQHRRSRWWKELSLLRRNLRRFLEVEKEEEDGIRKGVKNDNYSKREGGEERIAFLRERLFPRCWIAFSGLVGDNQYAALGLMLLGTLGRLGMVLGWERMREGGEAIEVLEVGGEAGREDNIAGKEREFGQGDEDLGVPLAREEQVEVEEVQSTENEKKHVRPEVEVAVAETQRLPAKKRTKKHRDAIDELFSGLI